MPQKNIDPCVVWLGYDSGNNDLPEPTLDKFRTLQRSFEDRRFNVILKTVREG